MIEENQGRNSNKNLEAGIQAESVEECCLLACSLSCAQPVSLHNSELAAQGGTAYSGLGPLTSIINQENAPQPSLMEAFSELRYLFTNDPGLCQVDKNNQHRQ